MKAHRIAIVIPENHEVTVKLPSDLPPGRAELIVLTGEEPSRGSAASEASREPLPAWLDRVLAELPPTPAVPLHALRREYMYEDE